MDVYKTALFKSRMFFGAPSPEKEAKRYKKLLLQQSKDIEALKPQHTVVKVDVVLLVDDEHPLTEKLLSSLENNENIRHIFLVFASSTGSSASSGVSPSFKTDLSALDSDVPLILMRSQDTLERRAVSFMYEHGQKLREDSDLPVIVSCDIDVLDKETTLFYPRCYPQWNPDLQLSTGYLKTGLFISGRHLIEDLRFFLLERDITHNSFSQWLCRLYINNERFATHHLSYSLLHSIKNETNDWYQAIKNLVEDESNSRLEAFESKAHTDTAIIKWKHDKRPLVSIIIPTYNAKELVKTCIESILQASTYRQFEIIIVDNNSDDPEAIEFFEQLAQSHNEIRVLQYPKPFNYSAINNFAVKHCNGEILAFVNNDIEVIEPKWLEFMVTHVLRDDIGCVGAKLLYPNKLVQHAGVVLGYGGGAGHAHKFYPEFYSGYMNRLSSTNNFSAVTAACLLVKKSDFEVVGGFDEVNLKVAFNDVDFCLKVGNTGKRNLYCAEAVLYHHESVSRGSENTPEKRKRFEGEVLYLQTKWAAFIEQDPCYSPNLTKRFENFALRD